MLHHHGGDVGALTEREWTPLHFAAWGGHTKAALMLGVLGAPLNARSQDGYSAADCARMRGFSELAATLTLHSRPPASPSSLPSDREDVAGDAENCTSPQNEERADGPAPYAPKCSLQS
jgi:ankyrin repeat protein